jgi:2-keto-4-pentenoate hydratase
MEPIPMEQSDIEDAAMFLLHLRTQRTQVSGLPGELAPKTLDQAYDIQDAHHRFAGSSIGMLKVGCTSVEAQEALGVSHPAGGQIPTEGVFRSGDEVPRAFLASTPLLECEVALRVGPNGRVDAAAPAIELVNGRFLDMSKVAGASLIADNSVACAAVLGEAVPIENLGDIGDLSVTLYGNDVEIASGNTQALIDGPFASVTWTLEHETSRGRTVEPGTWIITGTCTGLTPTEFGGSYRADFAELGSVGFTLE